jgi:galactose-1-phosphate uridylyltransferase
MVEQITPMFPPELVPEGRLRHGKAIVVPNLSPYSAYAGVAILGTEHYLPLRDIPSDLVVDGLGASISFLNIVKAYDPDKGRYGSIGWNYMPYSGGSIIHPHMQILAGPVPSNAHRSLLDGSEKYFQQYGINGWDQLIENEKNINERYLWQSGSQHWLATFAPRGIGDITIVFEGRTSLEDLTENDLKEFAVGLQRIFKYYDSIHLPSFNMALYPAPEPTPGYWLTARIVGRFTIFNITSDISSLQMLFGDFCSIISPEQITAEITKL